MSCTSAMTFNDNILSTLSTISYSSSTPFPSSYHLHWCPCCVESPASSSSTSLASSIPSCPCASGSSSSVSPMYQASGLMSETVQQRAAPSFLTLSEWDISPPSCTLYCSIPSSFVSRCSSLSSPSRSRSARLPRPTPNPVLSHWCHHLPWK